MDKIDVEQYIKDNYTNAKPIPYEDAGIEIKKSAQVRIKTQEDKDYYEIGSQSVSSKHELTLDDLKKQTKTNIRSLENQRLMVGDVLITIRAKFKYAKVVTSRLLSLGLPVVAVKGQIILRTNDINKAEFLKFYLERDEIRNYINNHENAKAPNGKYAIEPNIIQSILLPNIINSDLSLFAENSLKIRQVVKKGDEFIKRLELLSNKNRENFCKKDIHDTTTYSDIKLWEALRDELEKMIKATS